MSKFCIQCGKSLEDGAVFCNHCGAGQQLSASPQYTPQQYTQPQQYAQPQYAPQQYSPPQTVRHKTAKRQIGGMIAIIASGLAVIMLFMFVVGPYIAKQTTPFANEALNTGTATYKDPEPESIIQSEEWGSIPVNQLIVVFEDEIGKDATEVVLSRIGGIVVGELEMINLYQIEADYTTEEELTAAMDAARSMDGVELVFPNTEIYLDVDGVPCTPLKDPVFQNSENAAPYNIVGMVNAWSIIKGSGVPLNKVKVGVVDSAIYTGSNEFNGKVKVTGATIDDPSKKEGEIINGGLSHGTMVTHVIGADEQNSGMVGIASVLGENLTINVTNVFAEKEELTETKYNYDDITQGWKNLAGKAYTLNSLVCLKLQVDRGATVINCSFGPKELDWSNDWVSRAYEKFFRQIQKTNPKVIFVASAGNSGNANRSKGALNGKNSFPAGIKVSNLITVGAINNDGTRAEFSNFATGEAEVTLSAPGVDMVLGVDENGQPIKASGTSFSAPQVTAAIALIQSINSELNAEQIKEILVKTAAPGITTGEQSIPIPSGMGAGTLKVDEAVLRVINDMREEQNLSPFSMQQLLDISAVTLTAISNTDGYTITARIPAALGSSADVKIEVDGQHALTGETTQTVPAGSEASWDISLGEDSIFVRVARLDNGGCAYMTLEKGSAVTGVYEASGAVTMWGSTDPIKDFQAKVELDGTSMKITLTNDTNTVLTGTYDEATKTFVGIEASPPAVSSMEDIMSLTWWQMYETTIIFDVNVIPVTAVGKLYNAGNPANFMDIETAVDFTMTKVAD